jgi:hypothetical protein
MLIFNIGIIKLFYASKASAKFDVDSPKLYIIAIPSFPNPDVYLLKT